MADSRFTVEAKVFPGLITAIDPHDLPPGAMQSEDNLRHDKEGQIDVRPGLQLSALARSSGDHIISLYRFERPGKIWVMAHTDSGKILAINPEDYTNVLELGTGYSPVQPVCFAQSRQGTLIGVNGINAGFRWDGHTAALEALGMVAPTAAPTITSPTGGSLSEGEYSLAYRWLDDDMQFDEFGLGTGSGYPSNFSPLATHTAALNDEFEWADFSAPHSRVAKVELWRTTADQTIVYYRLKFTGASGDQTYIGSSGTSSTAVNDGGAKFTVPTGHGLVVNAKITMTGNSVPGYNTTHTITAVTATTITTSTAYSSAGSSASWVFSGYVNDGTSDEALAAYQNMPYVTADGRHEIANRFVPPPNDMPYVTFLQDRMFMAGTISYELGTVATTSGSNVITGTGTNWVSTLVGRSIYISGLQALATVTTYTSATSLTISVNATQTASGLSYAITPTAIKYNALYFSEADEPESMPERNQFLLQQNNDDPDFIMGLAPNNSELIVAQRRHLYAVQFFRQPDIDASPTLIANRGIVNNRCWCRYDNQLLMMDDYGIHVVRGGDVSDVINDAWGDETVSTDDTYFFAVANRKRNSVRFHLNFAETGYPKRWIEYAPDQNTICTGTFATGVASGVYLEKRTYYGSLNRRLYVENPTSHLDHASTLIRGTVTSATSTTITDSTASFTSALLESPVAIVSGTGKGQMRYVTAQTSTQLTVDTAWSVTPDATSVYCLGAIQWLLKTGVLQNGGRGENDRNASYQGLEVIFQPTEDSMGYFDMRRYIDHSQSVTTNDYYRQNRGDYVTADRGSSDTVVDTYRSRSPMEDQSGYIQWRFGGHRDPAMLSDRFCTIEMRGFSMNYPVTFYQINQLTLQ